MQLKCPEHDPPKCDRGSPFVYGKHCRICWLYIHDWRYRGDVIRNYTPKTIADPSKKTPCVHLGDEISGAERQRLELTHLKVWRECNMGHGPQCQCNANCSPSCRDYMASEQCDAISAELPKPIEENNPCLISIGHYNMPGIVELQAKVIRANCGNVPILVSDDHTEDAGEHGLANKARLLDICEEYGLIFRNAADTRVGHAGGDLGAFWHGLHYASGHDIPFVLKLSQRFVIDRPQFIQKLCAMMEDKNAHTMSQTHKNRGQFFFAMRTEFVLMRTSLWSRADLIAQLQPRPIGRAAEDIVYRCCQRLGGAFLASPLFTAERSKPHKDLLWYEADGAEGYHLMATKYGVTLGHGFHAAGSVMSPGFKWGAIMFPLTYLAWLSKFSSLLFA